MAKTVFDVLSEKIKEDIDSTTKFLGGGEQKISLSTKKQQV